MFAILSLGSLNREALLSINFGFCLSVRRNIQDPVHNFYLIDSF